MRQLAAQLEKAIDHLVDDAQHQVGRAGRQAGAGGARFSRGGDEEFGGVGVADRASRRVNSQQQLVEQRKTDRAGVDAPQDRRSVALGPLFQRVGAGRALAVARRQPAENE
jgi:hypothetical protein